MGTHLLLPGDRCLLHDEARQHDRWHTDQAAHGPGYRAAGRRRQRQPTMGSSRGGPRRHPPDRVHPPRQAPVAAIFRGHWRPPRSGNWPPGHAASRIVLLVGLATLTRPESGGRRAGLHLARSVTRGRSRHSRAESRAPRTVMTAIPAANTGAAQIAAPRSGVGRAGQVHGVVQSEDTERGTGSDPSAAGRLSASRTCRYPAPHPARCPAKRPNPLAPSAGMPGRR